MVSTAELARQMKVRILPDSQGPSTGHYIVSPREQKKNARINTVDKLL